MATIYVTLIVKGYKTYQQVPDILKTEVKNQLEALELGELAR
jgi:tryptophan synthase alpha subunit